MMKVILKFMPLILPLMLIVCVSCKPNQPRRVYDRGIQEVMPGVFVREIILSGTYHLFFLVDASGRVKSGVTSLKVSDDPEESNVSTSTFVRP